MELKQAWDARPDKRPGLFATNGIDDTGHIAFYVIENPAHLVDLFKATVRGGTACDLEDWGEIVASNYGEKPSRGNQESGQGPVWGEALSWQSAPRL